MSGARDTTGNEGFQRHPVNDDGGHRRTRPRHLPPLCRERVRTGDSDTRQKGCPLPPDLHTTVPVAVLEGDRQIVADEGPLVAGERRRQGSTLLD